MVSSAVLIPEDSPPEHTQQSNGSLKRRHSSISESSDSNKRPRLVTRPSSTTSGDCSTSPNTAAPSASSPTDAQRRQGAMSPPPPRRRQTSAVEQDKSRNRRLFGALLGTLSQSSQPARRASAGSTPKPSTSTGPVPSRREEIESRQRERLKRESHEIAESARLKKEQVNRHRRIEQTRWDEEAMRLKHRNMRAAARYLQTKTAPRLYYKPWELRNSEEVEIKRQVEDVEERIMREVEDFKTKNRNMEEKRPDEKEQAETESKAQQTSATPKQDGTADMQEDRREDEANPTEGSEALNDAVHKEEPSADDKTNGDHDADLELPDAPEEGSQPPDKAEAEVEAGVPASSTKSDEHDHGGEELEQGQEDDVIY